jgi:hypothetical protein
MEDGGWWRGQYSSRQNDRYCALSRTTTAGTGLTICNRVKGLKVNKSCLLLYVCVCVCMCVWYVCMYVCMYVNNGYASVDSNNGSVGW